MAGNTLTLTSPVYDTTGQKFGTAALSGGYGTAPNVFPAAPFTWEIRFKRSGNPSALEVITGQNAFGFLGMTTSGTVSFNLGANTFITFTSSAAYNDGNWHTAAIVFTGSTMYSFMDGALLNTQANVAPDLTYAVSGTAASGTGYVGFRNHGGATSYPFGGEVDEAAIWPSARYTAAYTVSTTAYAGTEGMVALYHFDSSGADSSSSAAVVIAANNAALTYVGNGSAWLVGSTNAKSINHGNPVRTTFTGGSVALTFDVSGNVAPMPTIWYSIDGMPRVMTTLAATVPLTMPSNTAAWGVHTLEWGISIASNNVNRWSPQQSAAVFTGLTLAAGGTVAAQPARPGKVVAFFGDSITEGHATIANSDIAGSDSYLSWVTFLRETLGIEPVAIGFGSQGILTTGNGGIPVFGSAMPYLWSGQARSFTGLAGAVVNMGTNDALQSVSTTTFQSTYQANIQALLAAMPAGTPIVCMRPFSGGMWTQIQAAVAAIANPRVTTLDTTGFFNTALSSDGIHPLGVANWQMAPRIAALLKTVLLPTGGITNRWSYSASPVSGGTGGTGGTGGSGGTTPAADTQANGSALANTSLPANAG